MGQRGPQPKPTQVKRLEGNPGQRKLNNEEPQPTGPLVRPAILTGLAATEWDRVVGSMPDGVYTSADAGALTVYCTAWANFQAACVVLAREGMMAFGSQGQMVAHPMLPVLAKQSEIILRAADRLGLTPAARTRLTVPESGERGKFDGLLGGSQLRVVTPPAPRGSARSSSN
jgi:P27 family predicted phage terminase small subunit